MVKLANTLEKERDPFGLQGGLRTAIAAGLSYWLTQLLHMSDGYWAAISAIVVMQSEVGNTLTASRDRIVGTAIGAVIGLLAVLLWHGLIVEFAFAVLVVVVLCALLRVENAGRLAGVTVAIIVLIPASGPVWSVAVTRFLEVLFGIAVSLGVWLAWAEIGLRVRRIRGGKQARRIDDQIGPT